MIIYTCGLEEAFEYQATRAAFAFQGKVRWVSFHMGCTVM